MLIPNVRHLNICQAALENGVKRVIHTPPVKFMAQHDTCLSMKHPLQPQSPYSALKDRRRCDGNVSFFNAFDLPVTIARPFNTYGPRQSARAVIPTISQIASGKSQIQLGDVSPTRDFSVTDTCRGFLASPAATRP